MIERAVTERGGVSMLFVGVVAIALVLAVGVARWGGAIGARARAETAADAAALAAARELALGGTAAQAGREAERLAESNGARLETCACRGPVVGVEVTVEWSGRRVWGRARAEVRARCAVPVVCRVQ